MDEDKKNPKRRGLHRCHQGQWACHWLGTFSLYLNLHRQLTSLAHTYGPIFKLRLGTKICIVVNSPSAAREILKEHDATFAYRDVPVAAQTAFYGGSDILWSPQGPEWWMQRKVGAHKMLGKSALDSVQAILQEQVCKTVSYLYSRVGSPFNLGEQILLTILNVITNMAWSGAIMAEDGEERVVGLGAEFRKVVPEMTDLITAPNVSDFYTNLGRFDLQGINKRMEALVAKLDEIFEKMINQRLRIEEKGAKERPDFLTFLLKLNDVGEGGDSKTPPMTMTHVKALLMVTILVPKERGDRMRKLSRQDLKYFYFEKFWRGCCWLRKKSRKWTAKVDKPIKNQHVSK